MKLPIIGISMFNVCTGQEQPYFSIAASYLNAVRQAGGLPWLIAPGEQHIDYLCSLLDGIIFTGGGDIDPMLYGSEPHAEVLGVDPMRDKTELDLLKEAMHLGIPILGICRGCQLINVACKGTLIQHLPERKSERVTIDHCNPPKMSSTHDISLKAKSIIASLLNCEKAEVVSWHHQAIDKLGNGLAATAYAEDEVIEAIEMPAYPSWLLGVQWHPEIRLHEYPEQRSLFAALIQAASRNF